MLTLTDNVPVRINAATITSTSDAQLVPSAVSIARLGPHARLVLTISATTGPGVMISMNTLNM
ncbi:hypothetical protein ALP29_201558 [Pseudomonas syringae pv. avii]|uniref:Uncharacterized protein n=1 Tax=Pseudomonas syringae pv. avii TaxID=663959 RepID=A0A3M5W1Q1_PSESX|nr:hypothetical protein ALP29_201558 [Pseudomonas syringae pv. avii]